MRAPNGEPHRRRFSEAAKLAKCKCVMKSRKEISLRKDCTGQVSRNQQLVPRGCFVFIFIEPKIITSQTRAVSNLRRVYMQMQLKKREAMF